MVAVVHIYTRWVKIYFRSTFLPFLFNAFSCFVHTDKNTPYKDKKNSVLFHVLPYPLFTTLIYRSVVPYSTLSRGGFRGGGGRAPPKIGKNMILFGVKS